MPPQQKNDTEPQQESEPEPCRPRTRAKNATQRPGVEAEKRLRIRRDPAVIQEEKDARKRKKEERERAQKEELANNEAAARFVEEHRARQKVAQAEEEASMPRRRPQAVPRQSKKDPSTTTIPAMAMKASGSGTMSSSHQKRGQKRGADASDIFGGTFVFEPTGNNERACPPAKKGKPSLKPNEEATGHPETPCRPAKKLKSQGIQRTETMMKLDGSNLIVRHSDDTVTVSARSDVLGVDEDATPCQRDFRADEISDVSGDEIVGAPSEAGDEPWQTPSALKKGHLSRDAFQSEMDRDPNSESEQAERGTRRRGNNTTTNMQSSTARHRHTNRVPGSPQSSSNPTARNTRVSSSVAVARSTTSAIISSATGLQTATLNGVVATRKSGGHASSSKSISKPPRIAQKVGMTEDDATDDAPVIGGLQDEDESLEHAAALASPLKGSDSRALAKGHIKASRNEPPCGKIPGDDPSTAPLDPKYKSILLPYWTQFRMAQDDPWKEVNLDDVAFVKQFWPRVFGMPLQHDITKESLVFKKLQARLWDYRNRIKAKAEQVVLERFKKLHGDGAGAIQDREKRIEFGAMWCDTNGKDYRFIWQGYDKTPGKRTGKFASACIVETLSMHFQMSKPTKEVPNVSTRYPTGGLALVLAALERAFTLFRDDHYEYKNGHLVAKKLLLEDTKRKPTSRGENKETRDARLDFSATNHEKMTCQWAAAIKKRDDILPAIYQRALVAAGISAKQIDEDTDSDSENDRANIESESETDGPEDDAGSE